jgi:uncharacterized protein (TIGR00255 family)
MLNSMTGYGKTLKEHNGRGILVEMRTLNSRFCDLSIKIPNTYRSKDLEIRNVLSHELIRGKIDFTIAVTNGPDAMKINRGLFKAYYDDLASLAREVGSSSPPPLAAVLQLPDVISSSNEDLSEEEWSATQVALQEVLRQVKEFRAREGSAMKQDLEARARVIASGLDQVRKIDPLRQQRIRTRIGQNLAQWVKEEDHDENRFELELLYYLEKLDINEEMVRLNAHLDHFGEIMAANGTEKGKMLGFIAQEMGREVNTISSKANDADMQKAVVAMKDELEKIKELLLNVL